LASATVPTPLRERFSPATTLFKVNAVLEMFKVPSYVRDPVKFTVRAVMLAVWVPALRL
jgi:hypothetical protein